MRQPEGPGHVAVVESSEWPGERIEVTDYQNGVTGNVWLEHLVELEESQLLELTPDEAIELGENLIAAGKRQKAMPAVPTE